MTHQYEMMVIFSPEVDERQVAPSLEKFLKVITNDEQAVPATPRRFTTHTSVIFILPL